MPIKKSRGLNDTAAIAASPADNLQRHESRSTHVEKIENGYVVRESSTKDGEYSSRSYFTKNDPNAAEDAEASPLRKAVDYMTRNGTV